MPQKKHWIWAGVAAAAVVALAAGAYAWYARSRPILTDRDVILLAAFVNTTGDPVLDGALKQALAVQLEQSPRQHGVPELPHLVSPSTTEAARLTVAAAVEHAS